MKTCFVKFSLLSLHMNQTKNTKIMETTIKTSDTLTNIFGDTYHIALVLNSYYNDYRIYQYKNGELDRELSVSQEYALKQFDSMSALYK